ncbi:MAG: hypothetical protein J5912_04330 [Clostridia bacterium]|nr:hypothetical protein [Clostridia bacterium]
MKILLTYFKPFGNIGTNSSECVANRLNIGKIGLDVSYGNDFARVKEAFDRGGYDFIIMLGQAAGREKISVEKRARNCANPALKDNLGVLPAEVIEDGNDEFLYTSFDTQKLLSGDAKESDDAGSYLCNFLYFKVLSNLTKNALFVHLPLFTGQVEGGDKPSMDLDVMVRETERIIKYVENDGENAALY